MGLTWWADHRVMIVKNLGTIKNILMKILEHFDRLTTKPLMGYKIHIGLIQTIILIFLDHA